MTNAYEPPQLTTFAGRATALARTPGPPGFRDCYNCWNDLQEVLQCTPHFSLFPLSGTENKKESTFPWTTKAHWP